MKIGILGAGISGLSAGKMLSAHFEVEVLEKANVHGGIARTKSVNGISYHVTGGHCFNSKYPDVLDFVFTNILPKSQWHNITRNAAIRFKGKQITYPIEFAVKQIFAFDKQLAINITKDFLNAKDDNVYDNLEEWFRKKFGSTLTDEYFLPYNKKIWNKDPLQIDPSWVEGKLPIPDRENFFRSLISDDANDKMPHSNFYYPDTNNQNTFIDKLAEGLNIRYNMPVESVSFSAEEKKWIVNNQLAYDLLINTLPLNRFPAYISGCPGPVLEAASRLKYNKVSTMLWETLPTERTWTYLPEEAMIFHRYIHIGNFFKPRRNYTITEAVGEKSYEEMAENGKKDPFLLKPLDYHVSDHAYVVFDDGYRENKEIVLNYLKKAGVHSLGRFAEWEYYNMDVCIKKAIDLTSEIINFQNK